jgi:hypothetical protein
VNFKTGTPALAADEVAYVTSALGDRLAGIEIGNEPDNNDWPPPFYGVMWSAAANAVVHTTPGTYIISPGLGALSFDATFVPIVSGETPHVQLFTQHFYIDCAGGSLATMGVMLSPSGVPYAGMDALRGMLSIPFRMAETNSYFCDGQPGVSDTFGSALWAINYLFGIAKHGGVGANFHTRSPNVSSVLLDTNGTITQVRPIYYGLLLFTLGGTGTALATTQDAQGLNVTAHAIRHADGSTAVYVLNLTATQPIQYTIDLGRTVTSAQQLTMTAPSLDAKTGVEIQGATVGLDGSFTPGPATPLATSGTAVSGNLGPSSAALITVP